MLRCAQHGQAVGRRFFKAKPFWMTSCPIRGYIRLAKDSSSLRSSEWQLCHSERMRGSPNYYCQDSSVLHASEWQQCHTEPRPVAEREEYPKQYPVMLSSSEASLPQRSYPRGSSLCSCFLGGRFFTSLMFRSEWYAYHFDRKRKSGEKNLRSFSLIEE